MTDEGMAAAKQDAPDPDDPRKPESPHQVRRPGWRYTVRAAGYEFLRDQGTDLAAGMTFYGVLSLFPALLAVFSLIGLLGHTEETVDTVMLMLWTIGRSSVVEIARAPLESLASSDASGLTLVAGLLGALWSASGYVGVFARMMNRVYEVDEGRGMIRLKAQQLFITVIVLLLAALLLVGMVVFGPLAEHVTWILGLGVLGRQVFNVGRWFVLLLLAVVLVAVLYYFTPNVRQPRFRWLSVGAVTALSLWLLASYGFFFYVGHFGSYNQTYGTLGGIIVVLMWIWFANCALVLGAEVDAELERARQLQAGIEAERTIHLPPRDIRASIKQQEHAEKLVERARQIRLQAQRRGEVEFSPEETRDRTPDPDRAGGAPVD